MNKLQLDPTLDCTLVKLNEKCKKLPFTSLTSYTLENKKNAAFLEQIEPAFKSIELLLATYQVCHF